MRSRKGLREWERQAARKHWDVPYLTIDPRDIGREYREVIRVNSQSGKGGVAYLLESEFGIELPKEMQREFGPIANDEVDRLGREVSAAELKQMFWREYIERDDAVEAREVSKPKSRERRCEVRREIVSRRQAQMRFHRRRQRTARRVCAWICTNGRRAEV